MQSAWIDVAGVAAGMAVYAIARGVLGRGDLRRDTARRGRVDELLTPYEPMTLTPLPVHDELPANVRVLRPRPRD